MCVLSLFSFVYFHPRSMTLSRCHTSIGKVCRCKACGKKKESQLVNTRSPISNIRRVSRGKIVISQIRYDTPSRGMGEVIGSSTSKWLAKMLTKPIKILKRLKMREPENAPRHAVHPLHSALPRYIPYSVFSWIYQTIPIIKNVLWLVEDTNVIKTCQPITVIFFLQIPILKLTKQYKSSIMNSQIDFYFIFTPSVTF